MVIILPVSLHFNAELHGDLPRKVGQLELLTVLNLGGNTVTNAIPPELGALVNLTTLQLSTSVHMPMY